MKQFKPLRAIPQQSGWTHKDVMVVFGELFSRGYANGIVEEAKKTGMKIIYSTVGRRDENQDLRALTTEELQEKDQPLINVPLEAGFDLQKDANGNTPVDALKGVKMSQWQEVQFDWKSIEQTRDMASKNFRLRVKEYLQQLEQYLTDDANIIFVHTMAGGFPRAKLVMPITNKVFKGYDDRFSSSQEFWESPLGQFCAMNFQEVTGESFFHLIDLTQEIRERVTKAGRKVSYVAYGYHGTEILIGDKYQWQSYSPYLQGWAKLRLENIAIEAKEKNISACVFNCPEILTNSSSIFLGVEVSLYPLLGALKKEGLSTPQAQEILSECQSLLKEGHSIDDILAFCTKYMTSNIIKKWSNFAEWPQHNGNEQMKLMRESSAELIQLHKDAKNLITARLSEVVFKACGRLIFNEAWNIQSPVWWLGHDIIAKQTIKI
ncbi:MAG: hypothetical protein KDD40_00120 [Bdellovibrionales bacterium]|nr:hypothetical protein [Bdellovibrionales bacterium]